MVDGVDFGPRLENLVSHLIQTGRFKTRTEVIQAGLRMIEEREETLDTFSAIIEEGLADAEAHRFVGSADVQARLSKKFNQLPRRSHDT